MFYDLTTIVDADCLVFVPRFSPEALAHILAEKGKKC